MYGRGEYRKMESVVVRISGMGLRDSFDERREDDYGSLIPGRDRKSAAGVVCRGR